MKPLFGVGFELGASEGRSIHSTIPIKPARTYTEAFVWNKKSRFKYCVSWPYLIMPVMPEITSWPNLTWYPTTRGPPSQTLTSISSTRKTSQSLAQYSKVRFKKKKLPTAIGVKIKAYFWQNAIVSNFNQMRGSIAEMLQNVLEEKSQGNIRPSRFVSVQKRHFMLKK